MLLHPSLACLLISLDAPLKVIRRLAEHIFLWVDCREHFLQLFPFHAGSWVQAFVRKLLPLLQPREMDSRLKDIPEWTKQASTPTFLLKVSNKEGTGFSRCAKKRCQAAKGKRAGIQYLPLSMHDGNAQVSCGLITAKQGSVFILANSTHTFRTRIRDKPLVTVSVL